MYAPAATGRKQTHAPRTITQNSAYKHMSSCEGNNKFTLHLRLTKHCMHTHIPSATGLQNTKSHDIYNQRTAYTYTPSAADLNTQIHTPSRTNESLHRNIILLLPLLLNKFIRHALHAHILTKTNSHAIYD